MPKFKVSNITQRIVKEFKPGIGTFEFGPGESIEFSDEKLARSLVEDSKSINGYILRLEVVESGKR